jgi:hypothetical protein
MWQDLIDPLAYLLNELNRRTSNICLDLRGQEISFSKHLEITQKMIDHALPHRFRSGRPVPTQHCADHALTEMCGASSKKLVTPFVSSRS